MKIFAWFLIFVNLLPIVLLISFGYSRMKKLNEKLKSIYNAIRIKVPPREYDGTNEAWFISAILALAFWILVAISNYQVFYVMNILFHKNGYPIAPSLYVTTFFIKIILIAVNILVIKMVMGEKWKMFALEKIFFRKL